jgi:CheY-like chemotaxis protein
MNTVSERVAKITLITDDNDNAELIGAACKDLINRTDAHPVVERFVDSQLTRWVTAATAEAELETMRVCDNPALIILDIMVRRETRGGIPGTGAAGINLLDWLTARKPDIPVIVLRAQGIEGLEARLLQRLNIESLSIGHDDFNGEFAKALSWLSVKTPSARRRITVQVGHYDTCYSIKDGHREVKSERHQYANEKLLDELGQKTDAFRPACATWQKTVRELGDEVFKSVIHGTLGPHILTLLRQRVPVKNESHPSVDLRFEIFVPRNELAKHFGVPFELAKHPDDIDNYLCTRVPMARRMRFEDTQDDDINRSAEPWPPDRRLRMLFINASFDGSATVQHEVTGEDIEVGVGRLDNTAAELKVVRYFSTVDGGEVLEPPTVLGGSANRICAQTLHDQFETLVTEGNFDLVHFAGHSVTVDGGGGTFLILPGRGGRGIGISVREIAEWIRQGGSRLVFVLSSCSGSSLRTAIETMRAGAEAVIGFRWDVNDEACVEYFRRFYKEYLRNKRTLPESYCEACRRIFISKRGLPIWASAIAVVRD